MKIRIRMEAYDHQALDASAKEIVDHAKRTGAKVAGPVPLPTRREIYTVNRSTFVNKKSREQFEIRTHKRIIDISEPNARKHVDVVEPTHCSRWRICEDQGLSSRKQEDDTRLLLGTKDWNELAGSWKTVTTFR